MRLREETSDTSTPVSLELGQIQQFPFLKGHTVYCT